MYIEQTNSTNTYLKEHPEVDAIYTTYQTAGRGQMGNSWESEKGKNVLLSVRIQPEHLLAVNQWQVCMAVSVALWQMVAEYIEDWNRLTIKWPNDLYYADKKLAGMLIEHTLSGQYLEESIVGVGLNVNQTIWQGSAPNPVSIKQITGKEIRVDELAEKLINRLRNLGITTANWEEQYRQYLYRRDGFYWWEEREVNMLPTMNGTRTAQSFEAKIVDITPHGELVLRKREGNEKRYHFKQIKYIV